MAGKYKITGFARLLFFLIIFTPIAYIGASYYNGEDGIGKIKDLIGINDTQKSTTSIEDVKEMNLEEVISLKDNEIANLKAQNKILQQKLSECLD